MKRFLGNWVASAWSVARAESGWPSESKASLVSRPFWMLRRVLSAGWSLGGEDDECSRGILAIADHGFDRQINNRRIVGALEGELVDEARGLGVLASGASGAGLMIEAGHEEALDVGGVAAPKTNTTGIRIDELAARLAGLVEREGGGNATDAGSDAKSALPVVALLEGDRGELECGDEKEEIAGALAEFLVLLNGVTSARDALGGSVGLGA